MKTILLSVLLLQAVPGPDEVPVLIQKLGSPDQKEREAAGRALLALGAGAVPALEEASRRPDPEIALRSREILRTLRLRSSLSERLVKRFPGVEARLAGGGAGEWTAVFLEAARLDVSGAPIHAGLEASDLNPLAGPALKGAGPEDAVHVCRAIAAWECRSALPELLDGLRHESARVRLSSLLVLEQFRAPEAASACIRLFQDPEPEIRGHAAGLTGFLSLKEARDPLLRLLGDESPAVRSAALRALAIVGDAAAAERIAPLVRDPGPGVATSALFALGNLGARKFSPDLVQALGRPETAKEASMALIRLRSRQAAPSLRLLCAATDPAVRAAAVRTLGSLGDRGSVEEISKRLRDGTPSVRTAALLALADLGDKSAAGSIVALLAEGDADSGYIAAGVLRDLGAREVADRLLPLLKDPNGAVRGNAAAALGYLSVRAAEGDLSRLLQDPDPTVRYKSIRALGGVGSAGHAAAIASFLRAEQAWIRDGAAEALGEIGSAEVVPAAVALLSDPSTGVRMSALLALRKLRAADAADPVAACLGDGDRAVRLEAARMLADVGAVRKVSEIRKLLGDGSPQAEWDVPLILARLGDAESVPRILDALRKYRTRLSSEDRRKAIEALSRVDPGRVVPSLLALLRDSAPELREDAAWTLGALREESSAPAIASLLGDPAPSVRGASAMTLGLLRLGEFAPRLVPLLGDADAAVRVRALNALGRLRPRLEASAVRPALEDPAPAVRRMAAWVLPDLGLSLPAPLLKKLLQDPDPGVRASAAGALCRLGSLEGTSVLLEEAAWDPGVRLFDLNFVRAPETTERLVPSSDSPLRTGAPAALLAELAAEARLRLSLEVELPKTAVGEPFYQGWREGPAPPRERILGTLSTRRYESVLEGDRIRVLDRDAARDLWRRWLESRGGTDR